METKKCKYCSNEFSPVNNRGSEQLYCSNTCQAKAAKERHEQRLKQKIYEEAKKQSPEPVGSSIENSRQSPEYAESVYRVQRPTNSVGNNGGAIADNYGKNYLELYYEAKIDNNFYKLKNENLEKRVLELEREIFDLNSELDSLDEKTDEGGMLGSIMEQFKKDPINSVKFASSIIENLTKSKK